MLLVRVFICSLFERGRVINEGDARLTMRHSQLEATGYHEAGHAVISFFEGVRLKSATIVPTADFDGLIKHDDLFKRMRLDLSTSHLAYLRAMMKKRISLAGPIAQQRYRPSSFRRKHAGTDYDHVTDLALRLECSEERASALTRLVELQTESIVNERWRFIEAVAASLLERRSLTGDELGTIIRDSI